MYCGLFFPNVTHSLRSVLSVSVAVQHPKISSSVDDGSCIEEESVVAVLLPTPLLIFLRRFEDIFIFSDGRRE